MLPVRERLGLQMTLPNFFVVGVQKGGTTSLHNYLSLHPDIYLPAQKETKFFARSDRYAQGIGHYEQEFFSASLLEKAVGEIDPDYMYSEDALDRISAHFDMSKLRIIFLLRNPIDRAYSHYLMTLRRGQENLSFDEAIRQESARIKYDYFSRNRYSYVDRGFYLPQIRRFTDRVGRDNILLLLSEQLQDDPREVVRSCFQFLDVDPDYCVSNIEQRYHGASIPRSAGFVRWMMEGSRSKRVLRKLLPVKTLRAKLRKSILGMNESNTHIPPMSDSAFEYLSGLYRPALQDLADYTKLDLSRWN
jgi:hypothetical protein